MKFLSFLGTGEYNEVRYQLNGRLSEPTRFVQRALIALLKEEFSAPQDLQATIFVTQDARNKSWGDSKLENGPRGLRHELEQILPPKYVRAVDIVTAQDEQGIWDVFNSVLAELEEDEEIVFDITHSFRYQPMLALLILHYAKVVRKIRVRGIYYGNVQILGPARELEKIPVADRIAPVVDLTSLSDLQEWITLVNIFLTAGVATPLRDWIEEKKSETYRGHGDTQGLMAVMNLVRSWDGLTTALQTCRSPQIAEFAQASAQALERLKADPSIQPAFRPILSLMEVAEGELSRLREADPIKNGLIAVRWCQRHGLIQQAYTMLNELIVTAICSRLRDDLYDKTVREKVNECIGKLLATDNKTKKGRHGGRSDVGNGAPATDCLPIEELLSQPFLEMIRRIKDDRNNLNHAGWAKKAKSADHFEKALIRAVAEVEQELTGW